MKFLKLLIFLPAYISNTIAQSPYLQNQDVPVTHNSVVIANAWAGGMNSMQFSAIDLDYDGVDDLFCFDRTCNKIMTYVNEGTVGNTNYRYAPEYETKFPKVFDWVLLVDYNGDGYQDIFTYHPGGLTCYRNSGNISTGLQFVSAEGLSIYGLINSYQAPNNTNIVVTSADIPAIVDVDNDGDIDLLTFGQYGSQIEYHKNLSMEMYGIPDSLKYERKNRCWGQFLESASTNDVYLDSCSPWITNVPIPESAKDPFGHGGQTLIERSSRHSGSTVLALDLTGEGVKEMLLGDISFTNIVALYNGGTTVNDDSPMISKDINFPSYDVPADLWLFPGMFYVDINNDGKRDLIISPNMYNQAEDIQSVWLYRNEGNDSVPDFNLIQEDFLQEDMIDVGIVSKPVFFDYNNDGVVDLFVGNVGAYDRSSNTYITSISQYKNVGTVTAPAYELITNDYEALSSTGFSVGLHPTFGDLNGDNKKDMIVGDADGKIHLLQNIATTGNDADFVLSVANYPNDTGGVIDVGYDAAPFLVDLDRDGDQDLIIGNKNGNITYYNNIGNAFSPSFTKISSTWGGVNVKTIFDSYGYATPTVIDNNGNYELYVGCNQGSIFHYDNIEGNLTGTFNLIDSLEFNINNGIRSCPAILDLNNDTIPDIINGNYRGGLAFYSSIDTIGMSVSEIEVNHFIVYPNPASNMLTVQFDLPINNVSYSILDVSGKIITSGTLNNTVNSIDISELSNGYYAFRVSRETGVMVTPVLVIKK